MKPLDLAKQLAASLADSEEYRKYRTAKEVLDQHEAAKSMFEDFRKKQIELEQKRISGEKLLEPYETELKKLVEIVGLNPYVREYLMAEYQFSQLMMTVQQTIAKAVGIELPQETIGGATINEATNSKGGDSK